MGAPKGLHKGSVLFWGIVIGAILLVELAGALGSWLDDHIGVEIPWTTISGMVGHLEDLWPTSAVVVVGIIAARRVLRPCAEGRAARPAQPPVGSERAHPPFR
jgi:hypothetical protein